MTSKVGFIAPLLVLAACTEADSSMIILQNQAPGEGCSIPSEPSAEFISVGRIDTMATEGYLFTPVIKSLAIASASSSSGRRIFIHGADVDLTGEDGGTIAQFSQRFSGYIGPGNTASFGFIIIPEDTLQTLGDQQVLATVKVFGELDGNSVDSQPFDYPVQVCTGCLQNNLGPCDALPTDLQPAVGGACQLLQDGVVDCCDNDGTLVCPAVPVAPPV